MRNTFGAFFRFLIRTSAFVGKEMVEVLRQTPLILTLVLGPFLIMLLFGIGYRNQARPLRTLLVTESNDPTQQQVIDQLKTLGPDLIYEGTTSDQSEAMQSLRNGEVDLVVVLPGGVEETIRNSNQVVIQFYHNEIDPYQVGYVEYFARAYIDEINRRVVRNYAEQGQESASSLEGRLADARQRVNTMRQALQAGDALAAQSEQQQLSGDVDAISLLVGATLGMIGSVDGADPDGSGGGTSPEDQAILDTLAQLKQYNQDFSSIEQGRTSYQEEIARLDELDSELTELDNQLQDFQSIDPGVLVSPFSSQTLSVQEIKLEPADFFAPAVVALLLQHLAVTFAALAIVREQRSGTMELFRISPLSALETLLGKYLGYILIGAILGAMITVTVYLGLKIPMFGSWVDYALVLFTLIFTALGVGFMISLFAKTDMQAVQYAMFILLGSVFFSGFFLDLRYLWEPVRVVSWLLPATYAINLLQSIMLRGAPLNLLLYFALLGIGILLFIMAWFLLRRRLQKEWS